MAIVFLKAKKMIDEITTVYGRTLPRECQVQQLNNQQQQQQQQQQREPMVSADSSKRKRGRPVAKPGVLRTSQVSN